MKMTGHKEETQEARPSLPEWIYQTSDEEFVHWCGAHKLEVCGEPRTISPDEREAIFRYALRKRLVN